MDIFSLYCFVTLSETGSFSNTGELLNISQSAVSKHISALEAQFCIRLFTREPHGVRLTPEGGILLRQAQNIKNEYEKAQTLLRRFAALQENRLVICTHSFLVPYRLSQMIWAFQAAHPELLLEVRETEGRIAAGMQSGNPDFLTIVFGDEENKRPGVTYETLMRDQLVVQFGPKHRLARRESVDIRELSEERFQIMRAEQEPVLRAFTIRQCEKAGFAPQLNPHGLLFGSTVAELLLTQDMISIQPKKIAVFYGGEGISHIPIDGTDPVLVQLVRDNRNQSETARMFIDFAKSFDYAP